MEFVRTVVVVIFLTNFILGQENAGTNVAPALRKCYNTTRYVTRDYRPPSSINVLVELVRKIEDASRNYDARELSYQILHRFRQDGIKKTMKEIDSSQGLPYSPKGWEAYKNRVQLRKLTVGNAFGFINESLSDLQACSLHFMVSSSIETQVRGDESSVCSRILQYTSRVHKRQIELTESTSSRSSCPIESGVVYTKWGAVKAGLIMAGIASGFQPISVPTENGNLDSRYGSTIAGELSEVALNQGSVTKTVGNKGGWNNTLEPKYYYLEKSDINNLYLTDAEIRGGLDGLYLALNIDTWKSKSSNIKISQILDMYYSRGVFNASSRACNRKTLVNNLIQDEKLEKETALFNYLLDPESQYTYSPIKENFPTMAQNSVNSLRNYITTNLNDLECSAESDNIERVSTEVLIFLDVSWNYEIIQPFISYVLENLDINKYESSYTMFDGSNCDIIVNKTRSILDFHEIFNLTEQQKYPSGFDYTKVVQTAESVFKKKLDNSTDLTGQSTIILMLPHNTPKSSEIDYVRGKRDNFRAILPDLRIIVAGSESKASYYGLVSNDNSDIFTIPDNTDQSQLKETGRILTERFKKIPRNVVNPTCGSSFTSSGNENFDLIQYVEPSGINYHKISPHYFNSGQTLKIRGESYGRLAVCTSRTDANPRANTTSTDCRNISSDEISLDISNYCTDESVLGCSPIYVSVEGVTSNVRCTENACRFPDNIKYTINLENVQCSSSSEKLFTSFLLLLLVTVTRF